MAHNCISLVSSLQQTPHLRPGLAFSGPHPFFGAQLAALRQPVSGFIVLRSKHDLFTRSSMAEKKSTEDERWITPSANGREHISDNPYHHLERTSAQTGNDEAATSSIAAEDWKSFRAMLCKMNSDSLSDTQNLERDSKAHNRKYWAHQIPAIEKGCILVATENLDYHPLLRKSVVLLVQCSGGSIRGVMLNKKLPFALEHVKNVDTGVALGLAACPVFLGGPLDSASTFHLLSSSKLLRGFDTVLPGLNVGGDAALFSTIRSLRLGNTKAEEVHVHVGQMEWPPNNLSAEINVFEWWSIVSCSSSLLLEGNAESRWERIVSLI